MGTLLTFYRRAVAGISTVFFTCPCPPLNRPPISPHAWKWFFFSPLFPLKTHGFWLTIVCICLVTGLSSTEERHVSRKYFVLLFFLYFPRFLLYSSLSLLFYFISLFVFRASEQLFTSYIDEFLEWFENFCTRNSPLMKFCSFVSRTFIFGWSAFSFSFVAFNE